MFILAFILISLRIRWILTPPAEFEFREPQLTQKQGQNNKSPRIPRIVHQSYKTKNLPTEWKDTPSRWGKTNPDIQYMFWTDEDNRNLIATEYPWFLSTYDSYPYPIQRADAARYFAVLKHGGIYTDLDILPLKDIKPLLDWLSSEEYEDKEMIIAQTYNLGLTNALFAAVPGSKILDDFVHTLPNHKHPFGGFEFLLPHFGVLLSTGPTRFWIHFANLPGKSKYATLAPSGWGQCHQCRQRSRGSPGGGGQPGQCTVQPNSYFETTKGGSWHKWDTQFMNFILCFPQFFTWLVVGALIKLGQYLKKRQHRRGRSANDLPPTFGSDGLPLVQEPPMDKKEGKSKPSIHAWLRAHKDMANLRMLARQLATRKETILYFATLFILRII